MLDDLVIFGGAGDLTARLLLPALAHLESDGALSPGLTITGADVADWDDEHYREHVRAALAAHAPTLDTVHDALLARVGYVRVDVTDATSVASALTSFDGPLIAYLALPPTLFAPALHALAKRGLPDGSVVAIEKPFGVDLASARELNALLRRAFGDVTVFRNDHFLHAQTVQNIAGIRFANRLFEPLWNATHIRAVEITWDETLALEGRAGYYDHAGALRDMLANHLLQIVCLIAMEPPPSFGERDLRDARFAVLRAIPTPDAEWIRAHTVRARYGAGAIGGRQVPDYTAEAGVDPRRGTETFAQVTLPIRNWRWAGVGFTLRSGKALGSDRAAAVIYLRQVPHAAFADDERCHPNQIRIGLHPPGLAADINVNDDAGPELAALERVTLHTRLPAPPRPPYASLVRDVLEADPTLAVRGDEAEEAWRIMQPIVDAWADDAVPMREYPAGTTPDW